MYARLTGSTRFEIRGGATVGRAARKGVDIYAARGTPVTSVVQGTVLRMMRSSLGGTTLYLGASTDPNHLAGYAPVSDGQGVGAGDSGVRGKLRQRPPQASTPAILRSTPEGELRSTPIPPSGLPVVDARPPPSGPDPTDPTAATRGPSGMLTFRLCPADKQSMGVCAGAPPEETG